MDSALKKCNFGHACLLSAGCTEGSVRLVGGQRDTEGVVEVCFDDLWGLIAEGN